MIFTLLFFVKLQISIFDSERLLIMSKLLELSRPRSTGQRVTIRLDSFGLLRAGGSRQLLADR